MLQIEINYSRCVVSSLTEEGPNDLAEELNRGEPVDENAPIDEEDENWETWVPDPIDAVPCKRKILSYCSFFCINVLYFFHF